MFYFWKTWPEKCNLHCVRLDYARDKPLIDVSSARGLNEPRSGAFLSSRTDGEQTETDSPPLPPPYSFSIPLPFSVSLSKYPSSIHMRLLDTYLSLSASVSLDKSILHMSSPLCSHWKLYLQWWCPAERLAAVFISQWNAANWRRARRCFLWSVALRNGFTVVREKLDSVKSPVDP